MALAEQDYDTDDEEQLQSSQWYGVREATLFLVDATKKMFDMDKNTNLSHIQMFLKLYKQIIRRKLAWNMQDYLGVILFGTEESDADSAWKNIQTLQKLKVVTVDDLLLIRRLKKNNMKGYQSMTSGIYPLHDALTFAMDIYLNTKTVFTKRRIVLITCHSPEFTDAEKHRIRVKAASLKDLDVELHVMGVGKNWVVDQFYKDLIMLSRTTNGDGEVTSVVDVVQQIQAPTKNFGRLCFKISDSLELDVTVRTLCRKRRSLRKKSLSKATNEVLTRTTYFKTTDFDNDEENSDEDDFNVPFMIPEEIRWVTEIGGRKLRFTREERAQMKHFHPPAIKIIGTRPIPDDLFRYHVKRKYFVRPDYSSTRKDNLLVFGGFLTKCAAKKKMIVCAVTLRKNTQTNLCYMIPNTEWGGFYLSKVAYRGTIGDKSSVLHYYKTQESVTDKEVKLWEKAIDQLDIKNYHPHMFKSYKLECQIQMVERLALDKEPGNPPINTMKQSFSKTCEKIANLIPEFNNMYPTNTVDEPSKPKRARKK